MHPRFAAHTMWATSTGQSSSAWRPLGKETRTVSIHSGRCGGTRFWKNGSSVAPCGIPLQDRRTLPNPAQRALADGHEVLRQIELRLAPRREENFVRVRHFYRVPGHVELDERGSRHGPTVAIGTVTPWEIGPLSGILVGFSYVRVGPPWARPAWALCPRCLLTSRGAQGGGERGA